MSVVLHETDGSWDATWLGSVDAAVYGVRFAVESNGQSSGPEKAKAEATEFRDAIGSGLEIRQGWGTGLDIVRRIRVYAGRPAIVISAEITNKTASDVTLGAVRDAQLVRE